LDGRQSIAQSGTAAAKGKRRCKITVCFSGGPDGHVRDRFEFWCSDDEARERAKEYVDGYDIDLWQQERKIAEVKE
jgi:hypothetical protein